MSEKMADKSGLTKTETVMSIIRTADIVNKFLETELNNYGSTTARFAVMNALFVHGGTMTPINISKRIFRAKHSVTSMLKVLEKINYVQREANRSDQRSVNITITKKGWKATAEMAPVAEGISQKILSCLDEDQTKALMDILRQIRRHCFANSSETESG
jgi:DNA-binding MarR family transcriptional regulator